HREAPGGQERTVPARVRREGRRIRGSEIGLAAGERAGGLPPLLAKELPGGGRRRHGFLPRLRSSRGWGPTGSGASGQRGAHRIVGGEMARRNRSRGGVVRPRGAEQRGGISQRRGGSAAGGVGSGREPAGRGAAGVYCSGRRLAACEFSIPAGGGREVS